MRRFLVGVGVFVTLIALFYAEETWRCCHGWAKDKRQLIAQGAKLDFHEFIPPPVPDEQNFAATPLLRPLFDYEEGTNGIVWHDETGLKSLRHISLDLHGAQHRHPPSLGNVSVNELPDLEAWQTFYRGNTNYPQAAQPQSAAADVLVALSKFDSELRELKQASQRPHARFPLNYLEPQPWTILLPHLAPLKGISEVTLLRAVARLEAGKPGAGMEDIDLMFRLADSIKEEPFLISHLVRLAILGRATEPIREGLALHAWNDAALAELQSLLATIDLLAEYERVMAGKRAFELAGIDYLSHASARAISAALRDTGGAAGLLSFVPRGWFCANEQRIAQWYEQGPISAVDVAAHRVFPDRAEEAEARIHRLSRTPYTVLAKLLLPAVSKVSMKSARGQTLMDEGIIACALERYWLTNKEFPDGLDELVPRFLERVPHDVVTGKPLVYRRTSNGGYILYSVGWNQKDEGGKMEKQTEDGDWVWLYPPVTDAGK